MDLEEFLAANHLSQRLSGFFPEDIRHFGGESIKVRLKFGFVFQGLLDFCVDTSNREAWQAEVVGTRTRHNVFFPVGSMRYSRQSSRTSTPRPGHRHFVFPLYLRYFAAMVDKQESFQSAQGGKKPPKMVVSPIPYEVVDLDALRRGSENGI
jgi:hypothetical protein